MGPSPLASSRVPAQREGARVGAYGDVRGGRLYQEGQRHYRGSLCGASFSKSLVSPLAGSLDAELRVWRSRRLEAKAYPYPFVDAR